MTMVLTLEDSDNASLVPSPDSSATPLLPPCRICEEKASGLHYGVNTCEACKGFFRRSLNRKIAYRCSGAKSCKIGGGKRNSCAYCRYQKCLETGMSKDAIKTGRYTHEKRTRDIEEVKRLMGRDEKPEVKLESPLSLSPFSTSSPVKEEDFQFDSTIEMILKASQQFDMHAKLLDAEVNLLQKQQEYYEHYKLKGQIFGTLNNLSKQEYRAFYEATGIDLDDRHQMVKGLTVVMEQGIMRYIQFAKAIPEFETLSLEDQASLIKSSRFEYWFLSAYRWMNADLKVGMSPTGKCFHVQEISRIWEMDFVEEVFKMSKTFQNLNLNVEEVSVLKAIVITFSDRCDQNEDHRVEEIQWKLVLCLKHLVEKGHPHEKLRFARIFDRLTALRDLTEWNNKLANNLKMEWPEIQGSPLLYEILTL